MADIDMSDIVHTLYRLEKNLGSIVVYFTNCF